MINKLIKFFINLFLGIELKRRFRHGALVYHTESHLFYLVEGLNGGKGYFVDQFGFITPVDYQVVKDQFIPVKTVWDSERLVEYEVKGVDMKHYTVHLDGNGWHSLEDLNEGAF